MNDLLCQAVINFYVQQLRTDDYWLKFVIITQRLVPVHTTEYWLVWLELK